MIVKQRDSLTASGGRTQAAGARAELQMAHYLHRAFAAEADLHILNDLRLVDPEQPEHDGRPGVCQIDHLAIHRWGMFIIESKSVAEAVEVCDDGHGGDEWVRVYRGQRSGFASPIQQAGRQGDFLRSLLQRHRAELLGKMPVGLRTVSKLAFGDDQRGFRNMPIQLIVAISDQGRLDRKKGWKAPATPLPTFVRKADLVPQSIRDELEKHRRLRSEPRSDHGLWRMKNDEAAAVAQFLLERHEPREAPGKRAPAPTETPAPAATGARTAAAAIPAPAPTPVAAPAPAPSAASVAPACKSCHGAALTAHWGKFGYYWKCDACGTNTSMPKVCSFCNTDGGRSGPVRIRKEGPAYHRECESCGKAETIWTQR